MFVIAQELVAHDHPDEARVLFRKVAEWARNQPPASADSVRRRSLLVRALYHSGAGAAADSLLGGYVADRPTDIVYLTTHGLIAAQRGDTAEAQRASAKLGAIERRFRRGAITFGRARIATVLGHREEAIRLVRQARSEGVSIDTLHLDTEMRLLRGDAAFDALTKPAG